MSSISTTSTYNNGYTVRVDTTFSGTNGCPSDPTVRTPGFTVNDKGERVEKQGTVTIIMDFADITIDGKQYRIPTAYGPNRLFSDTGVSATYTKPSNAVAAKNDDTSQVISSFSNASQSGLDTENVHNDIAISHEHGSIVNEISDIRRVDANSISFAPSTKLKFGMTPKQAWELQQNSKQFLQENPTKVWVFQPENESFDNHDILDTMVDKVYSDINERKQAVDEYGYTYVMPAWTANEDYTVWTSPNHHEDTGLQTVIESYDTSSALAGLTLDERTAFWSEMQGIFDRHGIKVDARKEDYGYTSSDTPGCDADKAPGGYSWTGNDLDRKTLQSIQKEIADNTTLRKLFEKSENVCSGKIADDTLAQQYSIRVTDFDGNALAKDRIIVEAKNGNFAEMSVNEFKQMDRKAVTALLK